MKTFLKCQLYGANQEAEVHYTKYSWRRRLTQVYIEWVFHRNR